MLGIYQFLWAIVLIAATGAYVVALPILSAMGPIGWFGAGISLLIILDMMIGSHSVATRVEDGDRTGTKVDASGKKEKF